MTLKQKLQTKAEEMFDLYSRGLSTVYYNAAWEDVMKIVDKHHDETPINVMANSHSAIVRFWSQNGTTWSGAIRYKVGKVDAKIINGNTYAECEHKVRQHLIKNPIKQAIYNSQRA